MATNLPHDDDGQTLWPLSGLGVSTTSASNVPYQATATERIPWSCFGLICGRAYLRNRIDFLLRAFGQPSFVVVLWTIGVWLLCCGDRMGLMHLGLGGVLLGLVLHSIWRQSILRQLIAPGELIDELVRLGLCACCGRALTGLPAIVDQDLIGDSGAQSRCDYVTLGNRDLAAGDRFVPGERSGQRCRCPECGAVWRMNRLLPQVEASAPQ